MDEKYRSRKFILAVLLFGGGTVGLFTGHMGGESYAVMAGVLMGAYGFSNAYAGKQ